METVSFQHCWSVLEAQVALLVVSSSSALLGLVSLIFLWTKAHRFSNMFRSDRVLGESRTPALWSVNRSLVGLALWARMTCWKRKPSSPSSFSADRSVKKTQWTNTSRGHETWNYQWWRKLHIGLQATWLLCLSALPPELYPKRGLWTTEQRSCRFPS